jgi:hypothetical protein
MSRFRLRHLFHAENRFAVTYEDEPGHQAERDAMSKLVRLVGVGNRFVGEVRLHPKAGEVEGIRLAQPQLKSRRLQKP